MAKTLLGKALSGVHDGFPKGLAFGIADSRFLLALRRPVMLCLSDVTFKIRNIS
jgi:hypothetical protein